MLSAIVVAKMRKVARLRSLLGHFVVRGSLKILKNLIYFSIIFKGEQGGPVRRARPLRRRRPAVYSASSSCGDVVRS